VTDIEDEARQGPVAGERWVALVGPVFSLAPSGVLTTPHNSGRRLGGTPAVGDMRLVGVSDGLIEFYRADPGSINGAVEQVSWPVLVYGQSDLDDRAWVFRQLHSLAALLALAWGEPWQIRQAPLHSGNWRVAVPQSWSAPEIWHERTWDRRDISVEEDLPAWARNCWASVDRDGPPRRALLAWHQAILVTGAHPSLALIALTAAVEAAAALLVPGVSSSRGRFKSALQLVATPEQMVELKPVYSARSSTAHAGTLHGIEGLFGEYPWLAEQGPRWMSASSSGPEFAFVLRTLPLLTDVARAVVISALSSGSSPH